MRLHFPRLIKSKTMQTWLAFCLAAATLFGVAQAQETNPQAAVDSLMRSSLHVDPASGAMQMQIPLGEYRGRGGASLPVMLSYSSKVWQIRHLSTITCSGEPMSVFNPVYAKGSASGWTSNLGWFLPQEDFTWELYNVFTQQPANPGQKEIARLYVRLPDGSRHELRRDDNVHNAPDSHTGVYYSVDGARLKYDRTADILYLPDGSRYLNFKQINGAIQYVDRNGNTLTYNSGVWSDALGRSISAPLPGAAPSEGDYGYSLPGFNGSTITYTFKWRKLGDVRTNPQDPLHYKGDTPNGNCIIGGQQPNNLFSTIDSYKKVLQGAIFEPVVLSEIVLPNGRSYVFTYNVYGEIDKITYPTGGTETFGYGPVDPIGGQLDEGTNSQGNRGVVSRVVNDGVSSQTWAYSFAASGNVATSSVTAPDGTVTQTDYFKSMGAGIKYGFDDARAGMPLEQRVYDSLGTTIRRTLYELTKDGPIGSGYQTATRNARVTKQVNIILDTGGDALASATETTYDGDLNVTSTKYYGFYPVNQTTAQTGSIAAIFNPALFPVLKTEETTYLVNDTNISQSVRDTYRGRNLISLPTSARVKDGSGNILAQSSIAYDETSLQQIGSATNWIDPQTSYRGNLTTTSSWLNTTNTYLSSHLSYDQFGNVRTTTDAKGNQSQTDYSSTYSYAYATTTTSAVPDPTGQYGSTTALVTGSAFDINTGLLISSTDANGFTTTFNYADPLNRLKTTVRASGTSVQNQTTVTYDDTNRIITTTSDLNTYGDNLLKAQVVYDSLGRKTETRQYEEANNYILLKQEYDSMGRVYRVSNPYRLPASPDWTVTSFDALGRVKTITTPDSAVVTTSYSGNTVTATDQAGKTRRSVSDALGRLKEVYEDPSSLNYLTSYSYDALDNLTTVNQGSQTRTFNYDSLKHLTSTSNPESGTVSYQYDNNGNLTQKTDARSVVTTYNYDALNRNINTIYSDSTPRVNRYYDGSVYGRGRLTWEETVGVFARVVDIYDAFGQPTQYRQRFWIGGAWGDHFWTYASYDKAGHITTLTYPSGHSVSYNYDLAGRLADKDAQHLAFTGTLGDGVQRTYATGTSYTPFGGLTQEQFGTTTPIYHKLHYNIRRQLYDVRASTLSLATDEFNWNRGCIALYYGGAGWGASSTTNNGNVAAQQHWVPGDDNYTTYSYTQDNYAYDALNRLSSVSEVHGGQWGQSGTDFVQAYTYDRYGNRTIDQINTWGTNIPKPDFGVSTSNNRLTAPTGYSMSYDAAGNQNNDTYTGQGAREFNAENHITQAWANGQWQTYTYDGSGRRIKRKVNNVETWQLYGLEGELLAEYPATMSPVNPQKEYGYRNGELLVTADGNLALNRPTSQTSEGWGGVSSRAVDGNTDGNWVNNSVTHTYFENQPWWQVDLGAAYSVSSVELWNRTDCCADRLTNFNVILLDASQTVISSVNYSGQAGTTTTIQISGNARYVKVQLVGSNYLSLAEVKVWGQVRWLVSDQLGTPRMVLDQTGSLANMSRHDYLPFGEEVPANFRVGIMGYGTSDNVRQKFTQKDRDNETGLDYFGARYYGSTQGRFTSPDPLLSSGTIFDPQSWNRYAYASNNPLNFIDPTGLYDWSVKLGGSATDQDLINRANAIQDEKERKKALDNAYKIIDQRNQFREALAGLEALTQGGTLTASQQYALANSVTAYGKEGDGNKVIVGYAKQATGTGAFTDGRDAYGFIFVSFDPGHKGKDLIIDVAHEGSHVADWQAFNWGANDDFTQYETEQRAYLASSYAAQALGKTYYPNRIEEVDVKQAVWNSGWKAADIETKRSAGIDRLLANRYSDASFKPITPTNQGWKASEIKYPKF
jgi:RHS repeat-associated protein